MPIDMMDHFQFPIFLILVLILYWSFKKNEIRHFILLLASYFFYGYGNILLAIILLGSTIFNFFLGLGIFKATIQKKKKSLFFIALVGNLLLLFYFKYSLFFLENISKLRLIFNFAPLNIDYKVISIIGISFFTFSTISYVSEIYQGKMDACKNFLSFGIFIAYFPKIIAGPIVRPNDIINQLNKEKNVNDLQIPKSFQLILIGLFKKIVIANRIALFLAPFYQDPVGYGISASLTYIILYSIQIYADFSGYSEIVRGISLLFGINIQPNFLQPYLSTNIKEFWGRWHISLSNWIKDYIYIPLGGNRKGKTRNYINLIITMFLCGLWHGANITFIIWGLIHGFTIIIYNIFHDQLKKKTEIDKNEFTKSSKEKKNNLKKLISWLLTFSLVSFAWVFFRSPDISTALLVFAELLNFTFVSKYEILRFLPIMVILDIFQKKHGKHAFISDYHWFIQSVVYTLMIIFILYFQFTIETQFIYGGF